MHRIVFLDAATLAPGISLRAPHVSHELVSFPATAPQDVIARASEAEIVITNKVKFDAATIAALPRLKLIAIAATGYDHVDLDAARRHGVAVTNIRGYSTHSVPEHVFALILALRRQILPYVADVRAGQWQASGQFAFHTHPITEIYGKRLGLFGHGDLGGRVAALGRAFGMEVVFAGRKGAATPKPDHVPFEEVLATSDVLSLHCPLNEQTRNLIAGPEFEAMRKKPLLINTGRGGLVDEAALERALDAGFVGGAGIDVTSPEPPPADSAIMRLAQRPNVLVTPHVGWASLEAQATLAEQLISVIERFVVGDSMNRLV